MLSVIVFCVGLSDYRETKIDIKCCDISRNSYLIFGIIYYNIQQIHYRDCIHNREYHSFYYCDSKIFTIAHL